MMSEHTGDMPFISDNGFYHNTGEYKATNHVVDWNAHPDNSLSLSSL